jgi:hypothetical protein
MDVHATAEPEVDLKMKDQSGDAALRGGRETRHPTVTSVVVERIAATWAAVQDHTRLQIPPRAWTVFRWLARLGEVWLYLPPVAIAVSFSDVLLGPLRTGVLLLATYLVTSQRSSLKSAVALCSGMYLGFQLLATANGLGQLRSTADPALWQAVDAAEFCLIACGLSAIVLTIAVPASRTIRQALPGTTRTVVLWASSLLRWGFAGAGMATFLASALPADGQIATVAHSLARPILIAAGAILGFVVGGLKADSIAERSSERG